MTASLDSFYLQKTSLAQLTNWSVRYLLETSFSYNEKFDLAPIGSFLKRRRDIIHVQDEEEYQQVTVKINGNGVEERDWKFGKDIGTKRQYRASAGQFIMSKIDARNGAFGIVPEELDGAMVTNDFPVFDIDTEKILPQFFVLLTSTKEFISFAQSCSSGTTNRQRIDLEMFLNQTVPLPNLSTQEEILSKYHKFVAESNGKKRKAKSLKDKIEDYLNNILRMESLEVNKESKNFWTINFKDLERWDVWINGEIPKSLKYPNLKLKHVIVDGPTYGANVKGINKKTDTRYIRITDINESGELNEEIVSPEEVEEKYLLTENDFLIARTGNTVGKTFLYKRKHGRAIYAGYLVKFTLDTRKVIPEYVFYYTKSSFFKKWVKVNQRVSGQPNINGQEYLESDFVVPPKVIQSEIVTKVKNMREEIEQLKNESKILLINAKDHFRTSIFENK